jgi:hypothetical protein
MISSRLFVVVFNPSQDSDGGPVEYTFATWWRSQPGGRTASMSPSRVNGRTSAAMFSPPGCTVDSLTNSISMTTTTTMSRELSWDKKQGVFKIARVY